MSDSDESVGTLTARLATVDRQLAAKKAGKVLSDSEERANDTGPSKKSKKVSTTSYPLPRPIAHSTQASPTIIIDSDSDSQSDGSPSATDQEPPPPPKRQKVDPVDNWVQVDLKE